MQQKLIPLSRFTRLMCLPIANVVIMHAIEQKSQLELTAGQGRGRGGIAVTWQSKKVEGIWPRSKKEWTGRKSTWLKRKLFFGFLIFLPIR